MVDIGEEFKSQVPKATIDGKLGVTYKKRCR